jgi:hypothetical protein
MGWIRDYFKKDRSSNPSPDRTVEILRKHLDEDFVVFPMSPPNAQLQDLAALGKKYSVVFPAEFVAHLHGQFAGIYVEVKESLWPRPKQFDVAPFWSFLYGLHTYSPSVASEEWMRLEHVAAKFQEETGLICAPILRIVGDADVYCVDKYGRIVQYDHETNEISRQSIDFWTLFEREIEELKKRKIKKVEKV